jgi:hypothetical protein
MKNASIIQIINVFFSSVDHKHYVKSGDVGQMLKVGNLDASWESVLPKVPNDQEKKGDESKSKRKELEKLRTQQERAFKSKNGLTPPTANIVNRIYKHTSWDKKFDNAIVEKTETELILTAQAGEGGYPPPLIIEEVVEEPATMHNWPDTDDKIVLTGYESVKEYMRKAEQAEEVRMAAITKSAGKKAGSAFESGSYASQSPFHEGETPGDNDRDDIFETKSTGGYGKDLNDSRSVGSGGFPSSKSVNMDFASDINADVFASATQPSTFRGASPSPGPATVASSAPSAEKDRDKERRLKEKEVEKETPVYTQPLSSPPPAAPVVDTTANANAEALAKLTEEEKTLREEVRVKTQETEKAQRDMNEMANPMLRKLKAEPAYNKALAAQKEAEARLAAVMEQINKLM